MMASGVMRRPTKCNICGKETKRPRDLGRHILTHSNAVVLFYCKVPGCSFLGTPRKDNLRKHMRVAHGSQGQAPSQATQHEIRDSYEKSLEEQEASADHARLIWWAERGVSQFVRLQLAAGVDPDTKLKSNGRTSLHMAAGKGHEEIIRLLLDAGAAINERDESGETPLLLSAQIGHVGIVELLLDRGADPDNIRQVSSSTPLHAAAMNGHEAIARLLLDRGADPGIIGQKKYTTPQHSAHLNGHEAVARLLLDRGADIDVKNCWGETPLNRAAQHGHDAVETLMQDTAAN